MIDKKKEVDLWKEWSDGRENAKIELLVSLDPLIQKQVNRYNKMGLPRNAIETEARKLVTDSFKTYNPTKSAVGTHATNHLKHLQRFVLEYANVGKIPENRGLAISKYQNLFKNLQDDLGREPSVTELADDLSWSVKEVDRMQRELRKDLTITSVKEEEEYFEDILHSTDETVEMIEFIYFESDDEEKVILEHTFGLKGKEILDVKNISQRIGRPDFYVRRKRKKLAEKINQARDMGYI